jgi:hypothetical protein
MKETRSIITSTRARKLALLAVGALAIIGCMREMPGTARSLVPTSFHTETVARKAHLHHSTDSYPKFRDVASASGLSYRWSIVGKRPLNILQTIGNGCALLDYNNDGNLDILLVGSKVALYRGDGHGHFTDVSHETGLDRLRGHFLGCAVGDYDRDGFDDLYLSAYRGGVLLHNDGGKHFVDVTRQAGIEPQPWGTSCAFADVDGDGYLDLYIANYVEFDPTIDFNLCPYHGAMTGCGPNDYETARGVLYHNEHGHFRDVTQAWGINAEHGRGLGVAFADFDGSGKQGFAVANDLVAGDLFMHSADARLKNVGRVSGTALDPMGHVHAGMGIDWGDYDNDGHPDLFVTTFGDETKCLYHNDGGSFTYKSEDAGLDEPTLPYVGWGCKFLDADNDGWLDLMIANGHVQDNIARFHEGSYRQPTLFLRNRGGAHVTFEDASRRSGLNALKPIVGRGLAVGDFDNDGRVDALVVDSEGRPLLLHNETDAPENRWIGFKLTGTGHSNPDAYGATITVTTEGRTLTRFCHADGSYLSSSDPRVHFGLGPGSPTVSQVTIHWPDGRISTMHDVPAGRYYPVNEGNGS